MVWNNRPFLPRHVTTLSSTARRYTHSRGKTVTVSSKFRGNGTHGECVGHNATIRSWETTWTALQRQHLLRPFSNLMRWNIDDLFGNTSRNVLLWNDLQDSKVKYINQRHKGTSEIFSPMRCGMCSCGADWIASDILQKLAEYIAEDVNVHVKTPPHSHLVVRQSSDDHTRPPVAR